MPPRCAGLQGQEMQSVTALLQLQQSLVECTPRSGTMLPACPALHAGRLKLLQEEARDAFKELLVSTNVGSDWTWESTMRKIIADPRWASAQCRHLFLSLWISSAVHTMLHASCMHYTLLSPVPHQLQSTWCTLMLRTTSNVRLA